MQKFETNRAIRSGERICQNFRKLYCIISKQFQEEIDHCLLNITNAKMLLHHAYLSDLQNLFLFKSQQSPSIFSWKPYSLIHVIKANFCKIQTILFFMNLGLKSFLFNFDAENKK